MSFNGKNLNNIEKIFIGTANFNQEYGIGRRASTFNKMDLNKILDEVILNENVYIDTAQSYGGVEELIGKFAPKKLSGKVLTKITLNKEDTFKSTTKLVEKSLKRLSQDNLYGVLIHNSEILEESNAEEIVNSLYSCVTSGILTKIGLSSYESKQIINAEKRYSQLSIFQINENVIDQRNFDNLNLGKLNSIGKELIVRSIFLQGNLLVEVENISNFLKPVKDTFIDFRNLCRENDLTPLKVCLDYCRSISWASGVVIGVNSFTEYLEIKENLLNHIEISKFSNKTLDSFYSDPRNWVD
jgi:aryl-alcohol dehydrogenase-like predicted oxidoreductase